MAIRVPNTKQLIEAGHTGGTGGGTPTGPSTTAPDHIPGGANITTTGWTPAVPTTTNPQTAPVGGTTGLTQQEQGQLQSASALINQFLAQVPALNSLDPNGALAAWMTNQAQTLAGQGMDASTILQTVESTMNNPAASGDKQAQQVFDSLFPGYNQRIQNGYTNTDPTTGAGIAGYLSYVQHVQAYAQTAGLVPGTITAQDIGNAWAGDVSADEMSTRITTEYVNAHNALPAVQQELQNYGYVQGLSTGQLASYYLNPANTTAQLQQQFNSAVAGGEGTLTGFGEIGKAQAQAVGAFLSNQGQSNLSATQAAGFFTGNLGGGLNSLAGMKAAGFEQAQLGQAAGGPGTVDQATLIAAGMGQGEAMATTRRAAETRAAPSQGGGGFVGANQTGETGVGYGSQ